MAYDPHLADQMREALRGRGGMSEKRMFGGLCFLLNGNMLSIVSDGRYMFRVGKDQEPAALVSPGVDRVAMKGREMPGFVWVDADTAIDEGLDVWLDRAARYVGGLPPK